MRHSQLNDKQSMSYYLHQDLADYVQAGIFSVTDRLIAKDQYTWYLAPWLKNEAKFFKAEYNESVIPEEYVTMIRNWMVNNHYAEFFDEKLTWDTTQQIRAIQRLRDNTNLVENPTGTFIINEWDGLSPKVTLVID